MSSRANEERVRRIVARAWNAGDPSVIDELAAPDARVGLAEALRSDAVLLALDDVRVTVEELRSEGEQVVCRTTWRGEQSRPLFGVPPTPAGRVTVGRVDLFRFAGGRIREVRTTWDTSGLVAGERGAGPSPGTGEVVLDVDEIQGNILPGLNKPHQAFLLLHFLDVGAAKRWIGSIAPSVATLDEVVAFKRLYQLARGRRESVSPVRATWVNIAFTHPGLRKLTPDADAFDDGAFREGQHRRSAALGDPVDPASAGHPERWLFGGPGEVPDALLIVASDDAGWLDERVARLRARLPSGVRVVFSQRAAVLPGELAGHEHFGFRDGISQPGVRGRLSDAPEDFLTPRENPADPHQGKPGQTLVWPGEFVFGYPGQRADGSHLPGPVSRAGPRWAKNGSFLVLRRYRQRVEAFERFVREASARLVREHGSWAGLGPEGLAPKLVGRWRSGAPLARAPDADSPELARDRCANNHFLFAGGSRPIEGPGSCTDERFPPAPADPEGLRCPHAAHIRKSYPRDDLAGPGGEPVERHRILRRGIPFGRPRPAPDERGLVFVSYQASIERQFEHLLVRWMNDPDFTGRGDGHDPIVGQRGGGGTRTRSFALPLEGPDGEVRRVEVPLPEDWTVPTGGAYFFAPSVSALRRLGG